MHFFSFLVYDASVKIPPGVITGNYQQLGNYDECLQVKNEHGFTGKACSATVNFEIAKDNGKPRQLDIGDLLLNIAIASVSRYKYLFNNFHSLFIHFFDQLLLRKSTSDHLYVTCIII